MKKSDLKQLIKPLVKECIHEVLLEEVEEWVRNADGRWEKVTRVGFVNPLDVNKYKKAKKSGSSVVGG